MTSEIRANTLKNRVGLGTISFTDTGAIVSGIVTANSFSGPIVGDVTGAASQITVVDESSDTTCNPVFVTSTSGNLEPKTGTNLVFNSASGNLRTGSLFLGSVTNESKTQDGLILERNSVDGEVHITAGRSGGNYNGFQFHIAGASGVTKRLQMSYDGLLRYYAVDGSTERLRITPAGKVLVGDGSAITPSRNLDVRGTGHQQILIGSTNNAGASLMVDGQGGGDGSGGLYCTFEAASDGHLKIRNYDPTKSIIFGTGSNTGANDSVVIESNGKTRIKNAELSIESSASYTTHLNYNNTGVNYISSTNGGATYFRGSNNSITALTVKGNGEVELPTANYEFTENNFRSKVSEGVGNNNPATLNGAMTSLEGSKHSWNNTGGILDLTDYKRSDWQILEVFGEVNPNTAGSGVYSDPFHMTIYQGYGWNGSSVTSYIYAVQHSPIARDVYPSGTGNSGNDGITVVWYNGSSESTSCAYNSTTHYLRIKLDTGSFNTTYGCAASVRIFKRF